MQVGTVDCSYDLSKEELLAKISLCDAIVIRSATKVGPWAPTRKQGGAGMGTGSLPRRPLHSCTGSGQHGAG